MRLKLSVEGKIESFLIVEDNYKTYSGAGVFNNRLWFCQADNNGYANFNQSHSHRYHIFLWYYLLIINCYNMAVKAIQNLKTL